jgi:hypothetical protein
MEEEEERKIRAVSQDQVLTSSHLVLTYNARVSMKKERAKIDEYRFTYT